MSFGSENRLGAYLRDRRGRMDPTALGFSADRRRTPGLRREEVAQRSNISPTWYTWLEQGRGGAPSADVLDRIATGLMLTDTEREHLFLLGLGRPPEIRYRASTGVTPRLQRFLDSLEVSPAFIKTPCWDVVAWNKAASVVLADYATLPVGQRNILRRIFCDPTVREAQEDWLGLARFVVAAFRADTARAGAVAAVEQIVGDLSRASPEFAELWRENEVTTHGDGVKIMRHPTLGAIELEYSVFAVEGRPDLTMMVYNPILPAVGQQIRDLVAARDELLLSGR